MVAWTKERALEWVVALARERGAGPPDDFLVWLGFSVTVTATPQALPGVHGNRGWESWAAIRSYTDSDSDS